MGGKGRALKLKVTRDILDATKDDELRRKYMHDSDTLVMANDNRVYSNMVRNINRVEVTRKPTTTTQSSLLENTGTTTSNRKKSSSTKTTSTKTSSTKTTSTKNKRNTKKGTSEA